MLTRRQLIIAGVTLLLGCSSGEPDQDNDNDLEDLEDVEPGAGSEPGDDGGSEPGGGGDGY